MGSNNNNVATRKIVTAAHKLKNLEQTDLLKVRVGEYDASGFNAPEVQSHEEYTVTRILKHPQTSSTTSSAMVPASDALSPDGERMNTMDPSSSSQRRLTCHLLTTTNVRLLYKPP